MEIRKADLKDISTIRNLAQLIWPEAYGEIISKEQITYMLDLMYSEASLKGQMEKGHQFILAVSENLPIGFAAFSKKSDEEPQTFRLHKLYVLPRQHAQGVGSTLLTNLIAESKAAGANLLELNVNKFNIAKQFYDKKGFTILREEVLDIGAGYAMDDYVMVKAI
jgi:ribosomal protein S18 acetylase RimI-like enzyme